MNYHFCSGAASEIRAMIVNMLVRRDEIDSPILEQYVKKIRKINIKQMIMFLFSKILL